MAKQRKQTTAATAAPPPALNSTPSDAFHLSDGDRLRLISTHSPLKPSALPSSGNSSPLIVLSPEELEELANRSEGTENNDVDVEVDWEPEPEEEVPLWEELANDVLWTVPFGFLFAGLDYAVHAQFGQDLPFREELGRLLNAVPTIFLLTFLTSRPRPLLRPILLQSLLLGLCLAAGIATIHVTTKESYLKVMRQAPGLAVLWVWSVVKLDLKWAVLGLVGVAAGAWARGELVGVKWW